MKINIKATAIELTPAISEYVEKKISSVDKFVDSESTTDVVAQVEVGKTTKHHKEGNVFRAEVHVTGGGLDLYAVSEREDLYAAIDEVKDELARVMNAAKGKRETLTRRGAKAVKDMMRGLSNTTARGFYWGIDRLRFKGLKSFKKRP